MNFWITLILPLLSIVILSKIFHYLFRKKYRDSELIFILSTMIVLILVTILVMVINKIELGEYLYWLIVSIIISGYLQVSLDDNHFGTRLSKEYSLIISIIISSLTVFFVSYLLVF